MAQRRIALLRGINVGGHRKIPMAELRTLLSDELGLADVVTYIQSGNIVFTDDDDARRRDIAVAIRATIAGHFGFEVPVIVRAADALPGLIDRSASIHPTVEAATHDKRVNVGFLTARPTAAAIAALDPDRSPGDSIVVEADHAFVAYRTGQSSTKLTGDYIERVLGVGMTMRNLATVRKLADMA
jgi:uncharacterized protein (DUF1697 family)